ALEAGPYIVKVADSERSIGSSFIAINLKEFGFFVDLKPYIHYNLCTTGSVSGKIKIFVEFLDSSGKTSSFVPMVPYDSHSMTSTWMGRRVWVAPSWTASIICPSHR